LAKALSRPYEEPSFCEAGASRLVNSTAIVHFDHILGLAELVAARDHEDRRRSSAAASADERRSVLLRQRNASPPTRPRLDRVSMRVARPSRGGINC